MKVYSISDLHVDYRENLQWVHSLSRNAFVNDALLIGGDISHRFPLVVEALRALRQRFAVSFFVAGNHDLWIRQEDISDSLAKFRQLRALCDELDIELGPRLLGEDDPAPVWVVPLHSWYEKPEESETSLFVKKEGEDPELSMWVDNWAIRWPDFGGGINAADYFLGMNDSSFNVVKGSNEQVITFSHFLPRKELMFLTPQERALWKGPLVDPTPTFNFSRVAGSLRLDEQLRRLGSCLHIYGHQHRNRSQCLDNVRYLSYCLGYPRERAMGRTREVKRTPLEVWDTQTPPNVESITL